MRGEGITGAHNTPVARTSWKEEKEERKPLWLEHNGVRVMGDEERRQRSNQERLCNDMVV